MDVFLKHGVVSITFNPHAKFKICIFSRSGDIRGVPKVEKYVT